VLPLEQQLFIFITVIKLRNNYGKKNKKHQEEKTR
jgi:hypothetical protein